MHAGFEAYEYQTGVRDTQLIPGNLGARLRVVDSGVYTHFFLISYWDSLENMKQYAGEHPEIAVDYPEDAQYALISDPLVVIQEITSTESCTFPDAY